MLATIAANTKLSDVIITGNNVPHMLYIPAAMLSTAATFLVSDGTTPNSLLGDGLGNAYSVGFISGNTTPQAVPLDPTKFASVRSFQIIPGTIETSKQVIEIGTIPK